MAKRTPTTRDVALLKQLYDQGQLQLAAEFQRNAVWPTAAKAYLIDTILNNQPMPLFFFQRITSAQTGKTAYTVIDGQQRLRAIFDFLDGRFRLTQSKGAEYFNKRFHQLLGTYQDRILNYDLVVEELSGYSEATIRDMFIRMNKYVVKLSPQELRHAREDPQGKFAVFLGEVAAWDFWKEANVFTATQIKRMVAIEFAAEITILLIEGPQDKKESVDLYYGQYRHEFPHEVDVRSRLETYLRLVRQLLPNIETTRFRKSVDLYSLLGAIDRIGGNGGLKVINLGRARRALLEFAKRTAEPEPTGPAARYLAAASRQTDNIAPRTARIDILERVLLND